MIRWIPFNHNNAVYGLDHLHPKTVTFTQPAKAGVPERLYTVDVEFGLHCFTCERGENCDPALIYSDAREQRMFDFYRYELSKQLPIIVETLHTRKCYHTNHGNFFTIEIIQEEGKADQYEVYFTLSRSSKKGVLNLSLQSAYVRDRNHATGRRKKSVGFFVLLFNTLNNRETHPASV
jgi:hypothetical protein